MRLGLAGKSVASVVAGLMMAWSAAVTSAQEADRIAAAKKEGKLQIYSVMPRSYNDSIAKAFQQKYPFAQLTFFRSRGDALLARIVTEARAGRSSFDIVFIDTLETLELKRLGLLTPYASPQAQLYRKADKDPEGYWTDFTNIYIVISYNPELVPKDKVPRDWQDLLDPHWKRNIGLTDDEFEWFGSLLQYWGNDRGMKFFRALRAQEPQIRQAHTLLAQITASGEVPLAINYAGVVEPLTKKGAPLVWIKTTKPIVYKSTLVSIGQSASSPNLAKLFVDFCLSPEGQQEVVKAGSAPARPGISKESDELDLRPIPIEVIQNSNRYLQEFRQLFVR
ncbi:MAG: extracellular solute-binding protein [Deltaproteobacteria bacterium]|nr:extracellular solute-binding protein [Deltaproteobacteria bacterium]